MSTVDLHRQVAAKLKRVEQRYTYRRRQIVELLYTMGQPVHIPEILLANPSLAQSSVYRNLGVLEHADVVRRVITSDPHARYELAEDLTHHHHHLICTGCGAVHDVVLPGDVEHMLDESLEGVARSNGFTLAQHRLDLLGLCAACRSTASLPVE